MFRKLRESWGFGSQDHRVVKSAPPLSDDLLSDEPGYTEDDVEGCLREIRARRTAPVPGTSRTAMLLSLGAAEQFASECLEYGPEQTHRANATHLAMAVQSWASGRGRSIEDPNGFLSALLTLLEFRGGHKAHRAAPGSTGQVFVGCRLNEEAIAMLNARVPQPGQPQLGRIITELLG